MPLVNVVMFNFIWLSFALKTVIYSIYTEWSKN